MSTSMMLFFIKFVNILELTLLKIFRTMEQSGMRRLRRAVLLARSTETNVSKSSSTRLPRVRMASPDDLQTAVDRLEEMQGEIAAVADRMRQQKIKQLQITGWGKFERAIDLLREFSAHGEFAVKTAPSRH